MTTRVAQLDLGTVRLVANWASVEQQAVGSDFGHDGIPLNGVTLHSDLAECPALESSFQVRRSQTTQS